MQFYGRVWFRLYRPRVNGLEAHQALRDPKGQWVRPAARGASMVGETQFRFLNLTQSLPDQGGWNDAALEKLWLYNLHYFDDLNAQGSTDRNEWHRGLISRWIAENPPTNGNGWEPYPTSLRLVNWVKWLAGHNKVVPGMLESITQQTAWLTGRMERHLLGNHLFANAKALVFAGLLFEGPQASNWLASGLKIIMRELREQVLPDGGNFERSPMYHAIFLEDVLDLVNAATHWPGVVSDEQVSTWRDIAERMLFWMEGMLHPDGEMALFNDAAFGVAPRWSELRDYAQRLGLSRLTPSACLEVAGGQLTHFGDSGYVRMQTLDAVALLDVAAVGPDYLPGHAHADTLSFELSVFGQRVVVNGGTSRYGLGPERLHERGTASHSTVEVAGENSSEVWGGFRVARRAYPFDLTLQNEAGVLQVACSHDGYKRLKGAPIHRREWVMNANNLLVVDAVVGGTHRSVARYILHPSVKVVAAGQNAWQLMLAGGQRVCAMVVSGHGRIDSASFAPEFGIVLPTQCLAVELAQGQARVKWFWN